MPQLLPPEEATAAKRVQRDNSVTANPIPSRFFRGELSHHPAEQKVKGVLWHEDLVSIYGYELLIPYTAL